MKSGKGEGDGYRKEKKYGSGYMYFSYICNPCFSFFVAREEDHNCTGKDCPICACVHQAKQVLRNLGTTPAVGFFCQSGDLYRRNCYFAGVLDHFVDFVSSSKGKIK